MYYNEDWDEAKERYMAWWDGEIIDRVVIQVRAPKRGIPFSEWHVTDRPEFCRVAYEPLNLNVIRDFKKLCEDTVYLFMMNFKGFGFCSLLDP